MHAKKRYAQIGSRVFLKQVVSEKIMNTSFERKNLSFMNSCIEKNRQNAIRFPIINKLFRDLHFSKKLRGGLLGVWKYDLLAINGWNEDFVGWGKEDTELVARLAFSGIQLRKIKFAGITYHLSHPILSREKIEANEDILHATIKNKKKWCENGIQKRINP